MVRPRLWQWLLCVAALVAGGVAHAADDAQALLDKATDTKLSAESVADLNEVIKLCEQAIEAGLDDGSKKFANELLASTLSQRAELICLELFERPVGPRRGGRLVQMALADLQRTIELDPDQAEAQFLIGRLYANLGEGEKALAALNTAVKLTDNDPPSKAKALMIRAELRDKTEDRQADYDEAARLMPKDPNVLRFRGMFHLTQNHLEAAIADLNAAVELDPADADTYEARGLALSLAQKYDDAMESFNKAIELDPETATAYVHRGRVRAIKGDAAAALRDVEIAVKLAPTSVQARQLRASLLGAAGKFEDALEDMQVVRQSIGDDPEVLLQIAMLYQAAKQPQRSLTIYALILEADPENLPAFRGRADTYLSLGQQTEAIADYEQALKSEPKNSGVLNNLAWVLATSPDEKLRDGKRSLELAKLACEVTEFKQAHILSTLAAAYAESGDFDSAMTWSKKAVDLGAEPVKSQLSQELESYRSKKPWREAVPPTDLSVPEQTAKPDKAAPASDDTARAKRS